MTKKISNVCKLAAVLILLQAADGICTYIGVSRFGASAEANPLIRYLIILVGPAVALLTVKSLTLLPILYLTKLRTEKILIFLVGLYISIVIQWLLVLHEYL